MKICLVHEEYPLETNFGGIATYQKILAEYFASCGYKVIVITRGSSDSEYFENGVHVYRIKADNDNNSKVSLKVFRKKVADLLFNLQNNNEIDIIETPDWGANTIYFEKQRKVPLMIRLHTPLKIWLQYNNNDFGKERDLVLKWENKMLKSADLLLSCSSLLKKKIDENYSLNKKIYVLNNPFNYCSSLECEYSNNIIFVGSLEERKGVIILAKALNILLAKYSELLVYIIGKDTTRNSKNISTKEYMLSIIDKKMHNRVIFVGQIDRDKIVEYMRKSKLAVFPSLFDNFPYAVLEAMYLEKYIICSDNMGVSELVNQNKYNCLFKSGSFEDLADKFLSFYDKRLPFANVNNRVIVEKECNVDFIGKKTLSFYQLAIENFQKRELVTQNIERVLHSIGINDDIKKIEDVSGNLANDVKKVKTSNNNYIVKKYNYNYDFDLCNILYDFYEKNGFYVIRPINKNPIIINNDVYNVFYYKKHTVFKCNDNFLIKLIKCHSPINHESTLIKKCDKYYNFLKKMGKYKIPEEEKIVLLYSRLRENKLLFDNYLNHGDLSKSNILFYNGNYYLIDFDEVTITTELYDFANIVIKHKAQNDRLKKEDVKRLYCYVNSEKYTIQDIYFIIIFYLAKILLEKFYLYENNSIDLYSSEQKKDFFVKYLNLIDQIREW